MSRSPLVLLALTLFLALGCGGAVPLPRAKGVNVGGASANSQPTAALSYAVPDARVPIGSRDPLLGNPDAPITIVVFSDYQCPFCARARPALEEIRRAYPKTVRFVVKQLPLPFHAHAATAAQLAQGVFERSGLQAFERFEQQLYLHYQELEAERLLEWASEVGVARSVAQQILEEPTYAAKVMADAALAEHLGVVGTPTFLINGHMLEGAQPFEVFQRLIDQELQAISRLPKPSLDRNALYRQRTQQNFVEAGRAPAEPDRSVESAEDLTLHRVPIQGSPSDGPSTALVTLVVFTDFECPFCARAENVLAELRRRYGDDLRLVFKHQPLPFHSQALPAAIFAQNVFAKAGNAKFWQVAARLFQEQQKLGPELYQSIAVELGIGKAATLTQRNRADAERAVLADQGLASDLNVQGTPQFFINGRRLVGAQPIEAFVSVIEERLAAAKAMVQAGVPKEKVYEVLMTEAQAIKPSDAQE